MCKWLAICDSSATFQSVFSWFDQLLSTGVHSLIDVSLPWPGRDRLAYAESLNGVSLLATDWVQSDMIRGPQQCTDLQRVVKRMDHDESRRLWNDATWSLCWASQRVEMHLRSYIARLGWCFAWWSTAGHCKPSRILFILHAVVQRILLASTGGRAFASMYCFNVLAETELSVVSFLQCWGWYSTIWCRQQTVQSLLRRLSTGMFSRSPIILNFHNKFACSWELSTF